MTDQQTYTKDDGTVLLELRPDWRSAKNGKLMIKLPIVSDYGSVIIPAAELLAMIDTIDPDAMRAYLRETLDHLDRSTGAGIYGSPLGILEPVKVTPERLDAVPEADSPEDVDEHPELGVTERLALLERVRSLYPGGWTSGKHAEILAWIIDGPKR